MTVLAPPPDAVAAILGPTTEITTRVEIYEEDSNGQLVQWKQDLAIGMVDGSVNVSQSRDERRSLDLTLENIDGELDNYPGNFWYDKIIKIFRGVRWETFDFARANQVETHTWETQIGEFLIDSIETQHFPHTVHVTGRDYTKRLLLSLFPHSTTFIAGTPIESAIKIIALNAGITKFNLPNTGQQLGDKVTYDRGSDRWGAVKQLAESHSLEVYFDSRGYLTVRPFEDPTTSAEIFTFETGPERGNIATFAKKSEDTRIFNHVVATGEGSDMDLVGAEALNYEPTSPTRIQELGDRVYIYTSPLIKTQEQAKSVASNMLKIMALEAFEIGLEAIVIPWLEAGYIVRFVDPNPNPGEPQRYLLTDFTIPLKLGAMSVTGKRVTIVGSAV